MNTSFLAENINALKNLSKEEFEALYEFSKTLDSTTHQESLIVGVIHLM